MAVGVLKLKEAVVDEFDYDGEIIVTDFSPGLLGLIAYGE